MRRLPSAHSRCLTLLSLLLLFSARPLASETPEIELQAGFGGFLRAGALTPVAITLTNRGAKSVSGRLTVRQRGDDILRLPRFALRRDITIPARGRFYLRSYLPVLTDAYPMEAAFESTDGAVARAEAAARGTAGGIILSLSRRRILDSLQREIPGAAVTYPHYETLPADWPAYEAVRLIVFHDQELPASRVLDAVAVWTATGGELWISASPRRLAVNGPLLERLGIPPAPALRSTSYRYGAGRVRLLGNELDALTPAARSTLAGFAADLEPHLLSEVRAGLIPEVPGELHPTLADERQLPSPWIAAVLTGGGGLLLVILAGLLRSPGGNYAAALALSLLIGAAAWFAAGGFFAGSAASSHGAHFMRGKAGLEIEYRAMTPLCRFGADEEAAWENGRLFTVYQDALVTEEGVLRPLDRRPWHPFIYLLLTPRLPDGLTSREEPGAGEQE